MPQLDRLLSVLASQRAERLSIRQDEPARLGKGGSEFPVTRQALNGAQLLALLREVAPPHAAARLSEAGNTPFEYAFGDESSRATATFEEGRLTAVVTPLKPYANGQAGSGNGHAAHPTPLATPAIVPDESEARGAMEALLRQQAERRASDLHLRSGERPLMRI